MTIATALGNNLDWDSHFIKGDELINQTRYEHLELLRRHAMQKLRSQRFTRENCTCMEHILFGMGNFHWPRKHSF